MKLGTLWGYFPASAVEIVGETRGYRRADVERPRLIADFCGGCGTTTNWRRADPAERDRVGVNMRLFDPAELAGIQVRYGDRRNHGRDSGRSYREPTIFDGAGVCP